ncbi:MAG: pitrilysin family protein [Ignavibacteria bacterium]|jgi:zinc protease
MKFDRSKKPEASEEKLFRTPSVREFSLDNSLRVIFVEKKELPIIRINLVINAGSILDPSNKKGVSNLLAMCLDEGAGKYNSLELSEQLDLLGARFSLYSDSDNIHLTLQVLKENFRKCVDILSLILIEPHLNEKDFEREKRRILTRIKQLSDDPEYIANTSFEEKLLGKGNSYSYPALGLINDITDLTNNDINNCYKKSILPNNAFIVVVGDISENDLQDIFRSAFSDWKQGKINLEFENQLRKDEKKLYIVNKKDSVQTEIRTGHHTSGRKSSDYFRKHLMNTILGGQFTSRLNHNLREKNGYTYGAGSTFNYNMKSAYFAVSTSVGIENTVNALNEIFNELNKIKLGVTEEELEFAKSSIIRKFPTNFETYRQVASNIIGKIIFDLPEDYLETYLENIKSVSIEDVNGTALSNIHPDVTTTILVGDKSKLLKQLSGNNFGEIEIVESED